MLTKECKLKLVKDLNLLSTETYSLLSSVPGELVKLVELDDQRRMKCTHYETLFLMYYHALHYSRHVISMLQCLILLN